MFRKIFALLVRSLKSDARLLRNHFLRMVIAGIVLYLLYETTESSYRVSAPGLDFFFSITVANLLIISLGGAAVFASAIVEEKEEQTLPLLRMADIGPTSLLLGKWLPRLVIAVLLLLIELPFTTLSITLGGVLWSQVFATYWMLLAHLFLVGNVALFFSCWCHTAGGAYSATVVFLFLYCLVAYWLSWIVMFFGGDFGIFQQPMEWVTLIYRRMNCIERCSEIFKVGFDDTVFDSFFVGNMALGGLFFLASWLTFDRATAREASARPWWLELINPPARKAGISRKARPQAAAATAGAVAEAPLAAAVAESETTAVSSRKRPPTPTRRRVWDAALSYKDYYQIAGGPLFMIMRCGVMALIVCGTLMLILLESHVNDLENAIQILGWTSLIWGLIFLSIEAGVVFARVLRSEIKDRTWSTLVTLPRSIPSIFAGKMAGAAIALLPALAMVLFGIVTTVSEWDEALNDSEFYAGLFWIVSQFILAFVLSMYFSISLSFAIWPVAVLLAGFVVFLGNFFSAACVFSGGGSSAFEGFAFLFGLGGLVLTFVFYQLTMSKLEDLAADEK
jgi:ABC-type Na+ efflux pump permease subunit